MGCTLRVRKEPWSYVTLIDGALCQWWSNSTCVGSSSWNSRYLGKAKGFENPHIMKHKAWRVELLQIQDHTLLGCILVAMGPHPEGFCSIPRGPLKNS